VGQEGDQARRPRTRADDGRTPVTFPREESEARDRLRRQQNGAQSRQGCTRAAGLQRQHQSSRLARLQPRAQRPAVAPLPPRPGRPRCQSGQPGPAALQAPPSKGSILARRCGSHQNFGEARESPGRPHIQGLITRAAAGCQPLPGQARGQASARGPGQARPSRDAKIAGFKQAAAASAGQHRQHDRRFEQPGRPLAASLR